MKNIVLAIVNNTMGDNIVYIPIPCCGTVHSVSVVGDDDLAGTETLSASRGADVVNLITVPIGDVAGGVIVVGVPDVDNKGMIFNPDAAVAAEQVIKLFVPDGFSVNASTLSVMIAFDDSAYVEQPASEA